MNRLLFATTNRGKLASLRAHLVGLSVWVEAVELSLVEPQSTSVEEVALAKARQAYEQLQAPVLVQDTGFEIPGLNGFPGPYARDMLTFFGPEGFLRLAEPLVDRRCRFVHRVIYTDATGRAHIFRDDEDWGTLAHEVGPEPSFAAWSALARIFIPEGSSKPLSAFTPEAVESLRHIRAPHSALSRFVRWYRREHLYGRGTG